MEVTEYPLDELIPYINNARTHDDVQVSQIAASISEFGFTNPILIDEKKGIIAGHGRLMAAKKLGLDNVPCITLEGLTEAQKKAYVIADNQLALNAGWDLDALKLELDHLAEVDFDIELLGFSEDMLDALNEVMPDFSPADESDQGKLDELEPIYIACPHCGKEFNAREA